VRGEPAVIDLNSEAGLARIDSRRRDVDHANVAGFVPESSDVAGPTRVVARRDPLAVVAPEGTYFVTAGAAGTVAYGRDGEFALDAGRLCSHNGAPVLGYGAGSRALAPLRVDPHDGALGGVTRARIEPDGTFAYDRVAIDPRGGERRSERVVAGRVALARFPAGTQPVRIDATHVRPPAGVAPRLGCPGDSGFPVLLTQARDLGRVDLLAGLERLDDAYIAYGALRAAFHGRAGLEKAALELVK
jgi:hypothetical protein